jgi:hypothetical protein
MQQSAHSKRTPAIEQAEAAAHKKASACAGFAFSGAESVSR